MKLSEISQIQKEKKPKKHALAYMWNLKESTTQKQRVEREVRGEGKWRKWGDQRAQHRLCRMSTSGYPAHDMMTTVNIARNIGDLLREQNQVLWSQKASGNYIFYVKNKIKNLGTCPSVHSKKKKKKKKIMILFLVVNSITLVFILGSVILQLCSYFFKLFCYLWPLMILCEFEDKTLGILIGIALSL